MGGGPGQGGRFWVDMSTSLEMKAIEMVGNSVLKARRVRNSLELEDWENFGKKTAN